MALPIDKLDSAVTAGLAAKTKFATITKEQILDHLDTNRQSLLSGMTFISNLEPFLPKMKQEIMLVRNPDLKTQFGVHLYQQIAKSLIGTASKMESNSLFASFMMAAQTYNSITDQIIRGIDDFVAGKTLTIFSTKMSHAVILGLAEEADFYGKYLVSLESAIVSSICTDVPAPAPYLVEFMNTNFKRFADLTNRIINSGAEKNFVNALRDYVKNGTDILLVGNENVSNVKFAKVSLGKLPPDLLASSAEGIGIFRGIGNWFFDRKDRKMRKLDAERKLLKAQVDLMKLDLDNVDPNTPEYQRMAKIIANYQGMIAKMDRELDEYYSN